MKMKKFEEFKLSSESGNKYGRKRTLSRPRIKRPQPFAEFKNQSRVYGGQGDSPGGSASDADR